MPNQGMPTPFGITVTEVFGTYGTPYSQVHESPSEAQLRASFEFDLPHTVIAAGPFISFMAKQTAGLLEFSTVEDRVEWMRRTRWWKTDTLKEVIADGLWRRNNGRQLQLYV